MIFCFGALAAMLVGFSQCTPKVLVSIQTFSDIFPSGFYSCNLQMPTTPSCFLFQLAFVFFVRLVKWNPGKTHIYFREVPSKCPSILADVSAEMLSLWFQEAVGEHCLLSHYGLWCGDIDRQGLGGDETHFFYCLWLNPGFTPSPVLSFRMLGLLEVHVTGGSHGFITGLTVVNTVKIKAWLLSADVKLSF